MNKAVYINASSSLYGDDSYTSSATVAAVVVVQVFSSNACPRMVGPSVYQLLSHAAHGAL